MSSDRHRPRRDGFYRVPRTVPHSFRRWRTPAARAHHEPRGGKGRRRARNVQPWLSQPPSPLSSPPPRPPPPSHTGKSNCTAASPWLVAPAKAPGARLASPPPPTGAPRQGPTLRLSPPTRGSWPLPRDAPMTRQRVWAGVAAAEARASTGTATNRSLCPPPPSPAVSLASTLSCHCIRSRVVTVEGRRPRVIVGAVPRCRLCRRRAHPTWGGTVRPAWRHERAAPQAPRVSSSQNPTTMALPTCAAVVVSCGGRAGFVWAEAGREKQAGRLWPSAMQRAPLLAAGRAAEVGRHGAAVLERMVVPAALPRTHTPLAEEGPGVRCVPEHWAWCVVGWVGGGAAAGVVCGREAERPRG